MVDIFGGAGGVARAFGGGAVAVLMDDGEETTAVAPELGFAHPFDVFEFVELVWLLLGDGEKGFVAKYFKGRTVTVLGFAVTEEE